MGQHRAPPIQWLVVFDAVADLLSFKKAAEQLHVSPSAVSQQIKSLETWLDIPLFERQTRNISLTKAGAFYRDVAANLVYTHRHGFLEFQRRFQNPSFHVSAPIFIAQDFMIPNYLSFRDFLPEVELRIEARSSYVDFSEDPVDAAIRYGDGSWPNLDSYLLCQTYIAPVCSPEYAAKNSLKHIEDLSTHKLISPTEDLEQWSKLLGRPADRNSDILICDSYLAAIKAASEGLGITLALLPSTNSWIDDGRLVLALDGKIRSSRGYWAVAPKRSHRQKEIQAFFQWARSLFEDLPSVEKTLEDIVLPT